MGDAPPDSREVVLVGFDRVDDSMVHDHQLARIGRSAHGGLIGGAPGDVQTGVAK
jgi:hypothetical protein